MRTRLRAAGAAVTSTILLLSLAVGMAPAASANAANFQLNGSVFGPNSYVTIDIGTLTNDCDRFGSTSDIYVVPAGSVGEGSALSDASGSPNTLMGTGLGGGVFDELIAITEPGGTLGPGIYDIVEDTCQDGIFNGTDSILRNAFEVVIPTDIPILPDLRIQEMKAGATAQGEFWARAAIDHSIVFAAITTYQLTSVTNWVDFYMTYVCEAMPTIEGSPVTPWCPTVGIMDTIQLELDAVKLLVDRALYYRGIAADPPDPDFAEPSLPEARDYLEPEADGALADTIASYGNRIMDVNVLSAAFLGSLEKYQGAALEDDAVAALMHARDIQSYARLLNTALSNEYSAFTRFNSPTYNGGVNANLALNRMRDQLASLEADGFGAEDERILRNLGATPAEMQEMAETLLDQFGSEDVPASMTAVVNALASVNNQMAAAYTNLGNAMNDVISELEDVVAGRGETPRPSIVGINGINATTTIDTPRTLTVNCPTCEDVEWDLDGDGAFDDATGLSTSHVFTRTGGLIIGARGVNAEGGESTRFVWTEVRSANRAPQHTAVTPGSVVVEAPIGSAQEFSVTPTDADGDVLTTRWFLDEDEVGAGTEYSFAPTAADAGRAHNLVVLTDDGQGRAATTNWVILPLLADEDSDGWTVNADCRDDDAAIHPGQAEIPGNGIDDDCDPTTLDTGPPVPSIGVSASPAIVGEEVVFTDLSSDPDGPIVSRSWDFDDDGVEDSTDAEVSHTYTAAGDVTVTLTVEDEDGNVESLSKILTVTERPVAAFSFSPDPALVGNPVTFTDASTDADGVTAWEWDFDYDGTTFTVDSTDRNPTHAFGESVDVALRVTDALGVASPIVHHTIPVSGPPVAAFSPLPETGLGDVARVEHGGAAVLWTSQSGAGTGAAEMIDTDYPSAEIGWTTGNGLTTDQRAVIDLGGGREGWQIEAVGLQAGSTSTQRPQNVRFSLSGTSTTTGYATVREGVLENSADLQILELSRPQSGRWLMYEPLDNRGGATTTTLRLQALTGQLGGATVTFQDRSTDGDGDDDIVSWEWSFGDGTTSTEQSPTHTFDAPGDYPVTLTVTDRDGLSTSKTLRQRVVAPLQAQPFTVPVNLEEGRTGSFSDVTEATLTDRAIVERVWDWNDGTTRLGTVGPPKSFADNGTYDVTLTLVDSIGMTSQVVQTLTVTNQDPTATAGADMRSPVREVSSGVFGATWTPTPNVFDPSSVDRESLTCTWEWGDGTAADVVQPCNTTTGRVPHVYGLGEYTATLTVADKDGGTATDTAEIVVEQAHTYLSVSPVPGTASEDTVTVRVKLWNADGPYTAIAGATVDVALGAESRTVTTDAVGEALIVLPLGADRELRAEFAGSRLYHPASDTATIPLVQRPPGDIVFTLDESGSMGAVQQRIRDNVVRIANQLAESLDYRISVMGFGSGFPAVEGRPGHLPRIIVPATDDLQEVSDAAAALTTGGGTEPGIDAIVEALSPNVGLRPGAGTCIVLVGDESTQQENHTVEDAAQALADNDALLFSIVTVNSGTADYQQLALDSGGAVFEVDEFADDPEPVLQALLASCATALVQRPDLTVSIDDGRADLSPGETVSYTTTITNVGAVGATDIAATVELPDGVSFVSAEDGGTASGNTVSWPLFDLASLGSTTRTLTVTVSDTAAAGEEITLRAEAFDDGANGNDLTPANNVDEDTDTILALPTLTVVTTVINDDGGTAEAKDFDAVVTGVAGQVSSDAGDTAGTVHALTVGDYTVGSTGLADYTTAYGGDCAADGTVSLAIGVDATCTITHDDIPTAQPEGTLTVITTVINDGDGTAGAEDFRVTIDGPSGPTTSDGDADGTTHTVLPGDYTVETTRLPGYDTTIGGDCLADGTVSVPDGGVRTCVIVHHDTVAPPDDGVLTIVVTVINDDGGTASSSDVTVTVTDLGGATQEEAGDEAGRSRTVAPGSYSISSSPLPGYTDSLGGDCDAAGEVTVAAGAHVTCVIVLNDIAPPPPQKARLTVFTEVINDDGGFAAAPEFQIVLGDGTAHLSADPGNPDGTVHSLDAGEYVLSAGAHPGYTMTIRGDCASDGAIELDAGQEASCTLVFDDIPVAPPVMGVLTLVTEVSNMHGGSAVPSDATIAVRGSDVDESAPGDATGTERTLIVGSYTVTASPLPGYGYVIEGDCSATGEVELTVDGATCTVTYSDVPGTLTVVLITDDSAAAELTVDGVPTRFGDATPLAAGEHTAAVTAPEGYAIAIAGACASDGMVSLGLDEHLICEVRVVAPESENPGDVPGEADPSPGVPGSKPGDGHDGLPRTGGTAPIGALVLGGVLLAVGAIVTFLRLRRPGGRR
ncbi:PKD domain-containing protein [Microbacterium soli]|uniref:PKD domain-containing protein n=1 Tax=Microbacterium soli TaxID=446075 RepID=A0ABP7NH43_9MICO